MGCGGSKAGGSRPQQTLKILTLGVAGSGKSTIAKQMKIIHSSDASAVFTPQQKQNYRDIIWRNLFRGLSDISQSIDLADEAEGEVSEDAIAFFKELKKRTSDGEQPDTSEALAHVRSLLADTSITELLSTDTDLIPPNFAYYVRHKDRVLQEDFDPTNNDILQARQRSTGLARTTFARDKLIWELLDAGGQPTERRKWYRAFEEDITAILFICALNEFDVQSEFSEKTQMEESLEEFESLVNSEAVNGRSVILFLNKVDLFSTKLSRGANVSEIYPNYKAGSDTKAGVEFFTKLFLRKIKDKAQRESIWVHATCAVDTKQVSVIFNAIFVRIFEERMALSGLG
mmetsp:Transcript_12907/g.14311  ORF Transcript_12907/g.14311 Transcript_12907/m.14311 type:complete len:344 (-) Transcript_12907:59-1090(-)|eukprot:CAMPEP_0168530000 /NCGR_PEP_ID=MMETSP0405-20121227/14326_1 /TAXON_ID=498012 /ORGANISM="Trichosphaerium sp, Strain Am-I-7 wt" /LENGTH=343 /DNA_ID=CAMNT_0008553997 /DNA_START=23 /DNA_END=1054 /DNA_ORIENTATION=+